MVAGDFPEYTLAGIASFFYRTIPSGWLFFDLLTILRRFFIQLLG